MIQPKTTKQGLDSYLEGLKVLFERAIAGENIDGFLEERKLRNQFIYPADILTSENPLGIARFLHYENVPIGPFLHEVPHFKEAEKRGFKAEYEVIFFTWDNLVFYQPLTRITGTSDNRSLVSKNDLEAIFNAPENPSDRDIEMIEILRK